MEREKVISSKKLKQLKAHKLKSSVDTFRNTFSNESQINVPKPKISRNQIDRKLPPLEFGALTPTQPFFQAKKKDYDVLSEKDMQKRAISRGDETGRSITAQPKAKRDVRVRRMDIASPLSSTNVPQRSQAQNSQT